MRFRAWDETERRMIEVATYHLDTGRVMAAEDGWDWYQKIRPIMQFTGLKDKNGKEIYEGDILDWKINSSHDMYLGSGEVVYIEGAFWSCAKYLSEMVRYHDAEVIGNIYEDEHLLTKKAE
jgi:uncharacterized phage protein (TIGR01671 family)